MIKLLKTIGCFLVFGTVFFWISPIKVQAAIAIDDISTNTGTGTTIDVTHIVSGSNRLMLVGISADNNAVGVSSVVWDPTGANESLTLVPSCNRTSANGEMWIYYLVAPTTGTLTLRATLTSNSTGSVVGVASFTGVDQSTPLGTCVTDSADPANISVIVSSETGGLVFDTAASDENLTADVSQTVQWDITTPANGVASTKAGATSVTMSYTGGATGGSMGAVPIKAASGGFSVSGTFYQTNETSGDPGQCDGSTANLTLRVNGASAQSTTCTDVTGAFTFSSVTASAGDTITIYSTGVDKANTVYVSDGSADTGINLYEDRLVVRDEQDGTVTTADLADWDNDNDATNMFFTANSNNLTVESGVELHVYTGDTYDPGGTVTTNTTGGNVHIDDSAVMYIDTGPSVIGADGLVDGGATLYIDANTDIDGGDITLTGTGSVSTSTGTPTVTISGAGTIGGGTGTLTFYNLTVDSTGTTTLNANLTLNNNLTVGDGTNAHTLDVETNDKTVDINGNLTISANGTLTASSTGSFTVAGSWTNSGTLTEGIGTITFDGATAANLNSGCTDASVCTTQNFYNLIINKTNNSDTVTLLTNHLRLTNTLTLTRGTLVQSSLNVRAEGTTAVSVTANGIWTNTSTGDLTLGGSFSNSGSVTFQGTSSACGETDAISITSTTGATQRSWTGTGTFSFNDVSVQDQGGTASITVYSGTSVSGNGVNWTFEGCPVSQTGNKMTVALWVKPNSSIASKALMVKNNEFRLVTDGSGNPVCQIHNGTAWQTAVTSSTALVTGSWQYTSCTYDQVNLRVFVNGVQTGQSSQTEAVNNTANSWRVGSDQGGAYGDYNGVIDEARIYNRALSPAEIRQLANWAPGPVGYWKMDENTGTTISDSSGNGNTSSTFSGNTTWAVGKFGSGLTFDGTDDVVRIAESTTTDLGNPTDSYSISAWFNTSTTPGAAGGEIVAKNDGVGTGYPFRLYLNNSNDVIFIINDGTNFPFATATGTYNDGLWHHAVGVRNTLADTVAIYIDGVLAESVSDTTTATMVSNDDISIGNGGSSYTTTDFTGKIDDVRIYNYVRTSGQIIEDMNGGHPAPGSPVGSPVSYWKMDEGYSTTAYDNSINSNDLTLSAISWTNSGKFGKAWNGDGALYLSRTNDNDFDVGTDDFSFSFWFKSDNSGGSGTQYIINRASSVIQGFAIYGNASGNIVFGVDDDISWGPDATVTSTSNLYDQTWHQITAVKTGSSRLDLYVDGKLNASTTTGIPTGSLSNDLTFYLADRDGTDNGDEFIGDLDEVKFFNSALTLSQAQMEYNHGSSLVLGAFSTDSSGNSSSSSQREYCPPGNTEGNCGGSNDPSPIAEWKMDENTGTTTTYDKSGNGNDLTFSSGGGSSTTVSDTFTEATDTTVTSHTPDTGTGWTNIQNNATCAQPDVSATAPVVNATSDVVKPCIGGASGDTGQWVTVQPNPTSADQDIIITIKSLDTTTNGRFAGIFGRRTDNDNAYVVWLRPNDHASASVELYLISSGSASSLGTYDATLAVNTIIKLEIRDATKKVYIDGTERISSIDNTLTSAGTWGLGFGRWRNQANTATILAGAIQTDWHLDDFTGNVTTTGSAPSWTAGKYGSALDFDGTSSYLSRADDADLDFAAADNFSVSVWAKHDGTISASDYVITKADNTNGGYKIYMDDSGDFCFVTDDDSTWDTSDSACTSAVDYDDSNWHFVTTVKTGTTKIELYVDGVLVATDSSLDDINTLANGNSFYVGVDRDGTSAEWDGQIDQIRVYRYARSPAQIAWDYNRGGPVGRWKFDESSWNNNCLTDTVFDLSGQDNHGDSCPATTGQTTPESGKYNTAMHFDDVDDNVTIPDDISLDLANGLTVSAWVNTDANEADNVIISKGTSYEVGINADGDVYWDGVGAQVDNGSANVLASSWHHIVITNNDTTATYYVDGLPRGTSSAGVDTDNITAFYIGFDGTNYFDGLIDDVRIYNYVLSTQQVKTVYNDGIARFGPLQGLP